MDDKHLSAMDLLVFSHLRWNFVFQRPQHLMTRFAKQARVFFWEEPIFDSDSARLEIRQPLARLFSIVPHLPASITEDQMWRMQEMLLADLLDEHRIGNFVEWYYNPLAINFTRKLAPDVVVY